MKKVLTLVLAICLVVGMCVPALAASANSAVGWRDELPLENLEMDYLHGFGGFWILLDKDENRKAGLYGPLDQLEICEGDLLVLDLYRMFVKADDFPITFPTSSQLSKLRLGKNLGNASKFVESVSIKNSDEVPGNPRTACVVYEFKDHFDIMKEQDFEIKHTLTIGGQKATVHLAGTFTFDEEDVAADQEDATAGAGLVLRPQGHAHNIALELEEGVTLTTTLNKGRDVRAWATSREVDEFDPLYESHKGLEFIYTVNVVNIPHGTVTLDIADPQLYVYDAEGKYLGTTKDELPLGKYYFLCNYQAESIVPPQLEEDDVAVGTNDMTLAEYITYLKTGELPERLKAVEEPEGETAAEGTTEAEGEAVPEATANVSLGGE